MRGWASILDDESVVYIEQGPNENAPLVLGQGLVLKGPGASGGNYNYLDLFGFIKLFLCNRLNLATA